MNKRERENKARKEKYANDAAYREKKRTANQNYYAKVRCVTDFLHGMTKTRTWRAWQNMRSRVMRPTDKSYDRYKDYSIDKRWERFQEFFTDMGICPEGMTLDREDNSKGYSKENCRWATPKQQARNRANNKLTKEKVMEIKSAMNEIPGYILSKKYAVSQQTICDIKHGRIWQEVSHV
jgi:hypothetical protein